MYHWLFKAFMIECKDTHIRDSYISGLVVGNVNICVVLYAVDLVLELRIQMICNECAFASYIYIIKMIARRSW